MMTKSSDHDQVPMAMKFVIGGMSGASGVTITHPLDLVKNRMQMSGEMGMKRQYRTSVHAVYMIMKNEGILAIYQGLTAALLRQATYTTTRLGIFTSAMEYLSERDRRPPSFIAKILIGMMAGTCAAFVGTPADLMMVRMTLDGRLPFEKRRNYAHVFDAFYKIIRDEGIPSLWRGCAPTVLRAMVANAVQLATYSQAKHALLDTGRFSDSIPTYFTASLFSSLVTTIFSMPMDIAKTRIQNMQVSDGVAEYRSVMDVWIKIVKHEGAFSLWKGFTPYYVRLAPQAVFMFVFLEEFTRLYVKYVMKSDRKPTVL